MSVAVLFVVIVGLPVLIYAFLMFDRIVRLEYETFKDEWVDDGKPNGFFWQAPECTWFGSGWARNRLSLVWLFKTPSWAADSRECQGWLTRLRVCVFIWNLLIVPLAIVLSGVMTAG